MIHTQGFSYKFQLTPFIIDYRSTEAGMWPLRGVTGGGTTTPDAHDGWLQKGESKTAA